MNRLAPIAFIATILLAGCTAPAHLVNKSEPTQDEKMQQTINAWRGTHISKAIQEWGSPNEVKDDRTGGRIYVWHLPVSKFLVVKEARMPVLVAPREPQLHPRHRSSAMRRVGNKYQLTFYTRPDGVIHKTVIKRNHEPSGERKRK